MFISVVPGCLSYASPDPNRMIKSTGKDATHMKTMRNAFKILLEDLKEKDHLENLSID
jgi:hypothetical protein